VCPAGSTEEMWIARLAALAMVVMAGFILAEALR
jgi:hypothetical protein